VCFIVCKTISELEHTILTSLYFVGAEKNDSWHARKRDLQCAFSPDVPMVPSSALIIATGGECLSSDVFSLDKTIRFGSLEFITDRFSSLILAPMGDGSEAAIMGSTRGGLPSPPWAMTGESTEQFHMALDEEGRIDLPSPRRHGMGASTALTVSISRPEIFPTAQAMACILPRQARP
jgi:hypothetical protein